MMGNLAVEKIRRLNEMEFGGRPIEPDSSGLQLLSRAIPSPARPTLQGGTRGIIITTIRL